MLREKMRKAARRVLAGLTMMTLCATAFTPAVYVEAAMLQENELNNTPAEADQLPLNTWMRGASQTSRDEDWYQITIPQGGASQVELIQGQDNPYSNAAWRVKLFDINRHQMGDFRGRSGKTYVLGLAPGKYYVQVKQDTRSGEQVTYNLRVNYTVSDSWEKEIYYGDKNIGNANIVYENKVYTGDLYSTSDIDWYRFRLSENNKISLRFAMDDTVAKSCKWKIELFEYNSKKALGKYFLKTNETLTVDKCSGDLLVKVSNYLSSAGSIYHLQLQKSAIKSTPKPTPKPTQKPAAIVKPGATSITSIRSGKQKAAIYWKKASNATGYYVYRATSPRGRYTRIAAVNGRTSYLDKKSLRSRRTYYYKIVSVRKSGSKVLASKASAYKGVKIK